MFDKVLKRLPGFLKHIYTLILVLFGWVLFAFDSVKEVVNYLKYMFGSGVEFINEIFLYNLISYLPVIIVLVIASTPVMKKIKINKYISVLLAICGFILSISYIVNSSYNPFLYFRF